MASDPVNAPIVNLVKSGDTGGLSIDDTSFLNRLDPDLARPILQGFADSMHLVFAIGAAVLAWPS